jgi:hypothetical protein
MFYNGKNAIIERVFRRPHSRLGAPPSTTATITAATATLVVVEADSDNANSS